MKKLSTNDTVIIVGATSAIARATAESIAQRGCQLILTGRDAEELEKNAQDLRIRFQVEVQVETLDILAFDEHKLFFTRMLTKHQQISGIIIACGELGNQHEAEQEFSLALSIIQQNFTGVVSLLTPFANYFSAVGSGFIAVITSVAGDRGRKSNYLYGAAKGGLNLYLQGLRNRLHRRNVQVLTIKPGFVDSRMTFGLKGVFLMTSPSYVGKHIRKAIESKRNIIYVPWFWRYIMMVIKSIPEFLFKRLSI